MNFSYNFRLPSIVQKMPDFDGKIFLENISLMR